MATPLKPEDVPKELECPICLSIPLDPRILKPCSHVFCKDCIHSSLSHRHFCPVCRSDCIPEQVVLLKDESSITHRIWSNIPIKCGHHGNGCTWTGAISDYKAHEETCPATCPATEMIRKLRSLERENKRLENETKKSKSVEQKLRAEIQEMRSTLEQNKQNERKWRHEKAELLEQMYAIRVEKSWNEEDYNRRYSVSEPVVSRRKVERHTVTRTVNPPKATQNLPKKKETLAQMRKRVAREMKEAEERRRNQVGVRSTRSTSASKSVRKETVSEMKARVAREFAAKLKNKQ